MTVVFKVLKWGYTCDKCQYMGTTKYHPAEWEGETCPSCKEVFEQVEIEEVQAKGVKPDETIKEETAEKEGGAVDSL